MDILVINSNGTITVSSPCPSKSQVYSRLGQIYVTMVNLPGSRRERFSLEEMDLLAREGTTADHQCV